MLSAGFSVWQSKLQRLIKIIITAVLLDQLSLFICFVRMREEDGAGTIVNPVECRGFGMYELLTAISAAILLIVLLIWEVAAVYDFTPKTKQK